MAKVELREAYLEKADLREADLRGADLEGADLRKANLKGARGLTNQTLSTDISLYRAIMPNGQKYEAWLQSKESGG